MRLRFLIIPSVLIFNVAGAQNGTASLTAAQANVTISASPATLNATPPADSSPSSADPASTQMSIIDYKSVYEAPTLEEEVKMATERFTLTPAQQEVWQLAATDRRAAEKLAHTKLDSNANSYERDGAYRGLRTSHNEFHDAISGYLTPTQKRALEDDRVVLEEKRRRLAKLPPPPPPAPTVTVAPVDSAAIKEAEKVEKAKAGKKSKKKKKAVQQ
jgi:hypothetical protein